MAGHRPTAGPGEGWHQRLAAGGWVVVSMPTDAGGRALPVTCEAIVSEELGGADRPPPPAIGHLAHGLALFGSPEQRADHLAGMISGTTRWCQGFSEPEAGSDLASVRTKADLVDGEWVIQGRKIWTSDANVADWILLLCRTGGPGHKGLSMLVVPTSAPGLEVSTIRTAWGSEEFAEVTFDGVRVPADAVVGEPGQGWAIAMSLLAVERGPADIGWISRFRRTATRLLADPVAGARTDVVRATAWLEALEATVAATLTARTQGTHDTSAGSVDKLLMTWVDQWLHGAALDAGGPRRARRPGRRPRALPVGPRRRHLRRHQPGAAQHRRPAPPRPPPPLTDPAPRWLTSSSRPKHVSHRHRNAKGGSPGPAGRTR